MTVIHVHPSRNDEALTDVYANPATGQPVLWNKHAIDVVSHGFAELVGTDAVDSATPQVITAAAHAALVGHVIRFTSGTYANYVAHVVEVTTNTIKLGVALPAAPTAADAFQILRYRTPVVDSSGNLGVSLASGASFPTASSATILSLTTAATGTNYTAFSSQTCNALDIVNNTGTALEYRRGAAGSAIPIPTGSARLIVGITNANSIDVRRVDTSNTQVTVTAEAITA